MAITYVDYIDKIKLSEDEVYEIVDTKARSQIITQNDSILSALTNSTYAGLLADNALLQLSIIEDVAGTLDWITSHGAFVVTEDTQVQEATIYFTYNQETGDYDPIVYPDQTKNPHEEGWYVLDITDSQTKFIMAHLAVTTRGLWILPSRLTIKNKKIDSNTDKNSSKDTKDQRQANANARQSDNYKILLSNDGMYIYDGKGREVVKYGSSIDFSGERPFYIGTENAYIAYYDSNDDGIADTIRIDGNTIIGGNVSIGEESKTLSQLLEQLDNKLDSASISVTPSDNGAIIDINGSTVEIMNGSSGTVYYTYIRYSANADGSNMQTDPDSTTIYMGIYTGTASTPPTQASYYKWSRYRGQDGQNGQNGQDGKGISSVVTEYGISDNASTLPQAASWQSTSPSNVAQGKWLWIRTTTTFTDATTSATFSKSYIGTDGEDGKSVYVDSVSKDGSTTTITLIDDSGVPSTFAIQDGADGNDGTPGAAGYVHFAWANSEDGTEDFSTSDSSNKKYLGVYTDNIQTDSTNASSYSWSLIRGADGANGTGISTVSIEYGISNASNVSPSTWSPTIIEAQQGQWLWVRNSTSYTDNTSNISYTKSYIGTDGEDGKSVNIAKSDKVDGVVTITLTDQNGSTSSFTIADGTDGTDGTPGAPGADGTSEYIHFAWAYDIQIDSSTTPPTINATSFSKSDSEGKRYLGVYSSTVSADSDFPSDYSWSLIKGADGAPGADGRSLTSVEEYYGSSTVSNVLPSTYGTSIITPSYGAKYIWNYEKMIYNNDTSNYSTTAPHIIATFAEDGAPGQNGQNGEDGKSLLSIIEYYAGNSSTATSPSTSVFTPDIISPSASNKYIWNIQAMIWDDNGNSSTTWTEPHIISMFSNGINGTTVEYYVSTSGASTVGGSWSTAAPSLSSTDAGKWLWVRTTTSYDEGDPDVSITKSYIGKDGQDGKSANITKSQKVNGSVVITITDQNGLTSSVTINDGEDGDKGDKGDPGQDGTSQYTHFAWANSEDGLIDFSVENSVSKKYIGVYADENQLDSMNPSDYSWTLIKGADGAPGLPGADGARGNVIVYPMEINLDTGSALLKAILFVDGYEVAGSTYEWSKITTGNATTVGTNASTYGINDVEDLNAIYNCTITWADYGLAGYAIAGISKLMPFGNNSVLEYGVADYGAADSAVVITSAAALVDSAMSKQTGSLDLRSAYSASEKPRKFITDMSTAGVFVHQYVENEPNIEPDSVNANGVHISDSVDIIRNGQVLAQYGQTAKIGKDGQANIEISSQNIVINNGSKQVASYGEDIQLGNTEENNVKITSQGISINNSTTTLANYTNDEIHLGTEDAAHLNITPNGITVNNSTKILASYGQEVTLGDTSGTYVNISTAGVSINNSSGVIAQYGQKAIIGDVNGFHIEIDPGINNGQIGFYRNANKEDQVAYINGDELNISKTVVLNQMNVGSTAAGGQWSWKVHKVSPSTQNNLYLKWLG